MLRIRQFLLCAGLLFAGWVFATSLVLPRNALQDLKELPAAEFRERWPGQEISDGSYPTENGFWATYQHANLTYFIGPYSDTNSGARAKQVFEEIRNELIELDAERFSSSRVGLLEMRVDTSGISTNAPPEEEQPPRTVGKLDGVVTNPVEQASSSPPPENPAESPFSDHGGGMKPSTPADYAKVPLAYTPFPLRPLPASTDLSGKFPPPGQQGKQNSCTSWSIGYALKSYHETIENRWSTRSYFGKVNWKTAFSPAYLYNQVNGGVDEGSELPPVLALAQTNGICRYVMMPYKEGDFLTQPSSPAHSDASKYILDFFGRVPTDQVTDAKAFLAAGFPLVTGLNADPAFEKLGKNKIWSTRPPSAPALHAVVTVGYDDKKQAFKIINSWGKEWGTDGFGWISYSLWPEVALELYVTKDGKNRRKAVPPRLKDFSVSLDSITPEKMLIFRGKLEVPRDYGDSARVEVQLFIDGKPLAGTDPYYETVHKQSASISGQIRLPSNRELDWSAELPIPAKTNAKLTAKAILFVDGYGIISSEAVPVP